MRGKRVFVSGGAGVIGLEMIPRLVAKGVTVLVGDLKPRPASFPAEVIYRQGDLNYMSQEELQSFAPTVFIHLAATFERSVETYGFWEENFLHNIRLSHHLMTIIKEAPSLTRVVFASSYLVYDQRLYQFDAPQKEAVRIKEGDPVLPRNLTGMAKLAHEIELQFLSGFLGQRFTTVCARIFRGYGRSSRDITSRWIRALLKGEAITLYRPEGLFDFIYAADSAEGLIRLADAQRVTGVVNLGTGRSTRVEELVEILRGHFPRLQTMPASVDIPFEASEADITLMKSTLSWTPEYDVKRAIPEIIAYERSRVGEERGTARPLTVLITSASKKVPLIAALQGAAKRVHPAARVVAGDLDPQALAAYVADDFWKMPKVSSESIDELIRGCLARGISSVLPTRDGELLFWAENAAQFRDAGIDVIVSAPSSLAKCVDKLAFSHFGQENRLPFIASALTPDNLPEGRYVVKERFGAGSRSIGLNLDRAAAERHALKLAQPIFQPFIVGPEISIDGWLDRFSKVKGVVLRRRDSVLDGESQITTTFRDASIERQAAEIMEALKLRGPVVLQAIINPQGAIQVIECNARFGGASTISIAAGLESFYWSLLETQGADTTDYPFQRLDREVRQVRVPTDLHFYGHHL